MNSTIVGRRKRWFRRTCGLWIRAMLTAPPSRRWENVCILYNLRREIQLGNIRWRHLRALSLRLSDLHAMSPGYPPDVQFVRAIAEQRPKLFLKGRRIGAVAIRYSRIVHGSAALRLVNTAALALPNDPSAEISLAEYVQMDLVRPYLRGSLRGRYEYVWCTRSEAVEALCVGVTPGQMANVVCEALGLSWMGLRETLHRFEILYPANFSDADQSALRTPAVFDGGGNGLFRSHRSVDRWGKTIHLLSKTLSAPEAVHGTTDVHTGFDIRYLGPQSPFPALATEAGAQVFFRELFSNWRRFDRNG